MQTKRPFGNDQVIYVCYIFEKKYNEYLFEEI